MGSYRCAQCGGEFDMPLGSSLAARTEAKLSFPGVAEQDMVAVCDECYRVLLPKAAPELLAQKSWRRRRWWSKK